MKIYSLIPSLMPAIALAFGGTAALAQVSERSIPNNDNTAYVGASVFFSSEYMGSAEEEFAVLPYLSLENVKGFDLYGTTLSYRLIEAGTGQGLGKWSFTAGPSVGYQFGRDSDYSPTLNGFEDVGGSLPIGGYVNGSAGPIALSASLEQDVIGGHGGLTADVSLATYFPIGNLAVIPSVSLSWGSNKHNDSFFSVTADQASGSGLAEYNAGRGIYSYSAGLMTSLDVSENYNVSLIAFYNFYTDDAADSPILNAFDGSKEGVFAAFSVSRKFDLSNW